MQIVLLRNNYLVIKMIYLINHALEMKVLLSLIMVKRSTYLTFSL